MNQNVEEEEKKGYATTFVPDPEIELGGGPEIINGKAEKISEHTPISFQVSQSSIKSPFLPPEYLEAYERIEPGLGKQLINVIITHQNFQIEVKKEEIEATKISLQESVKVNDANIFEQKEVNRARHRELDIKARGQIFAFIISIFILIAAAFFAALGHTVLAGSCMTIMVGMASILFLQKTINKDTDESKPSDE